MSILTNLKTLFTKKLDPAIFGYFQANSIPQMGEADYNKAYKGWVYACIGAIAEPVSTMEVFLEKKTAKGWEKVETHPALDVLYNVNDFYTSDDLWFWTEAMLKLNGNAFWYMVRDGNSKVGPPSEIWPLDPLRVTVNKSSTSFVGGYTYKNEKGGSVDFEPSEIIHYKKFNPLNPHRGMGAVKAGALAIDIDQFAAEWQRNFFGNSAMPSALLVSEGKMTQDQYDRVRANWDTKFKGVNNAHKLAILEGGMDFKPMSPTSREMQFSESRKSTRDEILATFRVPKVILGITEDVNLASASASEYTFSKFVIKPEMRFLVTRLNEFYLPLFNLSNKEYRFNVSDPVPENNDQKRNDRDSGVKNSYMTPNEARAQINLPPVKGGDELLLPPGWTPISMAGQNVIPTDNTDTGAQGAKTHKHTHSISKKALFRKEREIKIKIHAKVSKQRAYTQDAIAKLKQVYLKLNEELKSMLLENIVSSKAARRAVAKGRMRWKKDEAANEVVRLLFQNYKDWVALVLNASKAGMTKIMADSGKVALAEVNVDMEFDLENPRAAKWLQEHALEDSVSYSTTMHDDIASIVAQSIEAGQSVEQLTTDIAQFFSEEEDWRAERIARTETINAYSEGNLEGYRQSGVVQGKEWLTGGDNASCDDCQANEDQGTIDLEDNFQSGDDAPTAHPNCECALQPVTVNDASDTEE